MKKKIPFERSKKRQKHVREAFKGWSISRETKSEIDVKRVRDIPKIKKL